MWSISISSTFKYHESVFPTIFVNTGDIEPIQIKLGLKPGRFVKIGGSLVSELPVINISNLPNAKATRAILLCYFVKNSIESSLKTK